MDKKTKIDENFCTHKPQRGVEYILKAMTCFVPGFTEVGFIHVSLYATYLKIF